MAVKNPGQLPNTKKRVFAITLVSLAGLILLVFVLLVLLGVGFSAQSRFGDFGGLQMLTAQYTPEDVIGDLGGMPVTIPKHMAELVEYEGDPSWGQKRIGSIPARTHQSKITSFGIQFRYPDMATLSGPELWKDKRSKNLYNTDWMALGVSAASNYPGDLWMDRLVSAKLKTIEMGTYQYNKERDLFFGLTRYIKVNRFTSKPDNKVSDLYSMLLIDRDNTGRITTYIECSTVEHPAAPCTHNFSLELKGYPIKVYVQYRRPMVEHWREIQAKVTNMILDLKSDQNRTSSITIKKLDQ